MQERKGLRGFSIKKQNTNASRSCMIILAWLETTKMIKPICNLSTDWYCNQILSNIVHVLKTISDDVLTKSDFPTKHQASTPVTYEYKRTHLRVCAGMKISRFENHLKGSQVDHASGLHISTSKDYFKWPGHGFKPWIVKDATRLYDGWEMRLADKFPSFPRSSLARSTAFFFFDLLLLFRVCFSSLCTDRYGMIAQAEHGGDICTEILNSFRTTQIAVEGKNETRPRFWFQERIPLIRSF